MSPPEQQAKRPVERSPGLAGYVRAQPRRLLLLALILATFIVTAVLGAAAYRMDRAQRAAIDKALENYTGVASSEFANGITARVYWSVKDVFRPVAGSESVFSLPDDFQREIELRTGTPCAHMSCEVPATLRIAVERGGVAAGSPTVDRMVTADCLASCAVRHVIRYFFRYNLATREITLRQGPASTPPTYATKLTEMLAEKLDTAPDYKAFVTHRVLDLDGEPHMLVYISRRGPGTTVTDVYGFAAAAEAYTQALAEPLYRDRPLLPVALVGRAPGDSLYSIVIADSTGREYYRSPVQYEARFRGRVPIDPSLDPLTVELALRPETAERLVMGGIPKSRLPVIAALFALATVLLATVIHQLRREYQWIKARDYFVSGASHELRTPLAQIVLFADLLRLEKLSAPEERRRAAEVVSEEARRLTILVENFLRFSRGGAQPEIHPLPIALGVLVRDTAEIFTPLVAASGVTLQTVVDERLWANVDPQAVRQMLLNLLDNAVKYGREGGTVRVTAALDGDDARITVEDEGQGVPLVDRERMWEPFVRLAHHASGPIGGSGIGLAVVRGLTELHGGRASVENSATSNTAGARFVISLPGAWQGEAEQPPEGASGSALT